MFATRGFRLSALFVVLLAMFSVVAVDTAEARRGGSFGSRGTRTYQMVPATPTSPTVTAPVQRSTAAPASTSRAGTIAQATPAQRAGWFGGGIGGWIIGGFLFSGLFGLMFGAGFGGFGGFLALLVQVILIGLVLSWLFGRRRQPAAAGAGGASPYTARQDWQPRGGSAQPRASASAASRRAGRRDEVGVSNRDLDAFEQRLKDLQDAYAREDYEALRRMTTPEMMGYLSQELGENASKGVRNEVFDVRLLAGDIAEAWREGADQYATVSLKYESRDVFRDRTTGQVVSGDDAVTGTTELWTFVRRGSGPWLVSAIQET
jgi:predicted lipid-binding transport protein (Tim44 family)